MNLGEEEIKKVRIKNIKHLGREDVYNMEVLTHHNFSVNGGLIVHNCMDSDRYFVNTIIYGNNKLKTMSKKSLGI